MKSGYERVVKRGWGGGGLEKRAREEGCKREAPMIPSSLQHDFRGECLSLTVYECMSLTECMSLQHNFRGECMLFDLH